MLWCSHSSGCKSKLSVVARPIPTAVNPSPRTTPHPLPRYVALWHLSQAPTLAHAQRLIIVCIALCVPADALIIIASPLGSLWSVLIFYEVTVVFGFFIIHYVKVANAREVTRKVVTPIGSEVIDVTSGGGGGGVRCGGKHHLECANGVMAALRTYRPDDTLSAGMMAFVFAKDFVGFTCAASGIHTLWVDGGDGQGSSGSRSNGDQALLVLGFTFSVVAASVDMLLTLLYPGVDLTDQTAFLLMFCTLDIIEMASAVALNVQSCSEGPVSEQLVFTALFGVGVVNFVERCHALVNRNVDIDARLGLNFKQDM